ncbi:MAG TPA: tetratricopeptide repeat protein [Labilithrix sp.]|nr:tetratricopeptide repeat protein [Labilithrix sp.]
MGVALTIVAASPRLAGAQESGVAEAQALAKAKPMSPEASLGFGQALRRAGREAEALGELRRGLSVSGGRGEIATRLQWEIARAHIARREFEPAMATCRAMTKMPLATGADVASHVCAAEAHLLWRRGTEAAAEIAEVAKAKGPSAEAQYFAKAASGRALELASKEDEAEAAYREAIALAASRPDAHVLLGSLLRRTGRDGLPSLKKAVELDPRDPVGQLELGRALPAGGAESIAALERAVAERPTYTDALRALADGYVAARRLESAKRTVEAVLKLAPNDVASHVLAGRVALAEGRADEAIREGERASKLMPNDGPSRLLVADAWAKKGEIDLAVEAYQAAFGLDHSEPTALVNAAQACLAAGRVTSAKAFGVRATKDFATSAAAWTALGDALAADRDVPGARAAYETARKSRGVDAAAIDRKISTLK